MTDAPPDIPTEPVPAANEASGASTEVEPTPGTRLRAAREELKLSPFDVARELKLHPRQIDALERDDYTIFSSPVFVRGFLRNYARLVGLTGDVLVVAAERAGRLPESIVSPGHAGGESGVAPPKPGLREPFDRDRDSQKIGHKGNKHGVPVVVALLVAAAGIVYFHHESSTDSGAPLVAEIPAPSASPETVGAETVDALPQSGPEYTASSSAAEPDRVDGDPAPASAPGATATPRSVGEGVRDRVEDPTATVAEAPVSTPTLEGLEALPAPAKRPATPVSGSPAHSGDPEVRLTFTGESWVEVRDASGRVVFSDLGQPGQERVVKGQAPFRVVVGKSSGVSLTYNSRAVDLEPYTQAEVARLTLQ